MASLKDFSTLDISWDLTPEHAVTMYLEWGNNDWHSEYPPVRSKDDMSNYFVVDTWGREPVIRLVQRNSEHVGELVTRGMRAELRADVEKGSGVRRGISAPQGPVKEWLRHQVLG